MTKYNKERFQKLAGITPKKDDESTETLSENIKMFGLASPAVLGNPFGKNTDLSERTGEGSPESMWPSREDEEESRAGLGSLSDWGSPEDIGSRKEAEEKLLAQAKRLVSQLENLGDYHNLDKAVELLNSMEKAYRE